MLSTPPLKRSQMKYQAKNVQLPLPMEILKLSISPLKFPEWLPWLSHAAFFV